MIISFKTKYFLIFSVCFVASVSNGYFFNYINDKYFHYYHSNENGFEGFSIAIKFLIIVIIAPIIETAIFNLLPNRVLYRLGITNKFLLVVIPSIIFSLFHLYHLIYGLMALMGGIIMNWYFISFDKKLKLSFWSVTLLHSSYNLYGFVFIDKS